MSSTIDPHPSGDLPATRADVREVKKTVEAVIETKGAEAKEETARIVTSGDVKWFVATMVAVAGLSVSVWRASDANAQEKSDKVEQHLTDYKKVNDARMDRVERSMERQDLKTDAILTGLHLANPAPAPSFHDAGAGGGTP